MRILNINTVVYTKWVNYTIKYTEGRYTYIISTVCCVETFRYTLSTIIAL